jgi:adenosylcobinamide-GDP ribazoletransferase
MTSELLAAVAFLTRLRVPIPSSAFTGAAAYGLVGAAIGAAGALLLLALGGRLPLAAGGIAVAVLALVSGGLHLDGLADTADALAAPNPEAASRARQDPRIGAAGAAALTVAVVVDAGLLASLVDLAGPRTAALGCVIAAAGSRTLGPGIAWLLRRRRSEGDRSAGLGGWFIEHATARGSSIALASSLGIAAVASSVTQEPAFAIGLVGGMLLSFLVAAWLWRVRGGLDGDGFGFIVEVGFALILLVTVLAL